VEKLLLSAIGIGINNFRQIEIYTAEPLVPKLRLFEIEIAIEKLKR
jgi:hypothetical protein